MVAPLLLGVQVTWPSVLMVTVSGVVVQALAIPADAFFGTKGSTSRFEQPIDTKNKSTEAASNVS